MLWLLLLSSSISKWANLGSSGSRGLETAQLLLSSFVGFVLASGVAFSGLRMLALRKAKRANVDPAEAGEGAGSSGPPPLPSGKAGMVQAGKIGGVEGKAAAGHGTALATIRVTAGGPSVDAESPTVSPYADDTPHAA